MTGPWGYVVYRWRLAQLVRRLRNESPLRGTLLGRLSKDVEVDFFNIKSRIGIAWIVIILEALAIAILLLPVPWPELASTVVGIEKVEPLRRASGYLLAVSMCMLVIDVFMAAIFQFSLSRVNLALEAGANDPASVAILARVWERGRTNSEFLRAIFESYEPSRKATAAALGCDVEAMRSDGPEAWHAGSWSITLEGRVEDLTLSPMPGMDRVPPAQLERETESALHAYARPEVSNGRTQFLEQWRRIRSNPETAPLTKDELESRCESQELGLNYVLRGLSIHKGALRVEVGKAGYGQIIRSCDYLIEEAFLVAGLCSGTSSRKPILLSGRWLTRSLPARHSATGDDPQELLMHPSTRAAGIGLAGVVVRSTGAETALLYKQRSWKVGTYPGLYHVVPTGMFNAKCESENRENVLDRHAGRVLLTELLEECKDIRCLEGFGDRENWIPLLRELLDWWSCDPDGFDSARDGLPRASSEEDMEEALRIAASGRLEREHAGVSLVKSRLRIVPAAVVLDLLSLRPEMIYLIWIPTETMGRISLNSEGQVKHFFPREGLDTVSQLPDADSWVRSGYAAFTIANRMRRQGSPRQFLVPRHFGL